MHNEYALMVHFQRPYFFPRHLKKREYYRIQYEGISNDVKTGTFRRHTLRRLPKLVVTVPNFSFPPKINKARF